MLSYDEFLTPPIHCISVSKSPFSNVFTHLLATSEKALALPEGVVDAMHVLSCDPEGIVSQFQERLHLTPTALENPEKEDRQWIRCLANTAKSQNRNDVVEYLRTIVPSGTTGKTGNKY